MQVLQCNFIVGKTLDEEKTKTKYKPLVNLIEEVSELSKLPACLILLVAQKFLLADR